VSSVTNTRAGGMTSPAAQLNHHQPLPETQLYHDILDRKFDLSRDVDAGKGDHNYFSNRSPIKFRPMSNEHAVI